jgi:hypothetical protein
MASLLFSCMTYVCAAFEERVVGAFFAGAPALAKNAPTTRNGGAGGDKPTTELVTEQALTNFSNG